EVGAIRAEKVAKAFLSAGHTVTVIRAPGSEPDEVEPSGSDKLTLRTVSMSRSPRELFAALRARLNPAVGGRISAGNGEQTHSADWVPPRAIGFFKRLTYSILWLPDDRQNFVRPAAAAAVRALRANPGAILYSTSPPVSAHLAAAFASARTGAPW